MQKRLLTINGGFVILLAQLNPEWCQRLLAVPKGAIGCGR
jgi:hypothetical protein